MTKINNRLVIVIPTHRPNLTAEDKISLSHLKKHLPNILKIYKSRQELLLIAY